jgi:hypothetical protein
LGTYKPLLYYPQSIYLHGSMSRLLWISKGFQEGVWGQVGGNSIWCSQEKLQDELEGAVLMKAMCEPQVQTVLPAGRSDEMWHINGPVPHILPLTSQQLWLHPRTKSKEQLNPEDPARKMARSRECTGGPGTPSLGVHGRLSRGDNANLILHVHS